MNIEDFEDLVDRCGERPDGWPLAVRSEAIAFLESSIRAQQVVAEAASLRSAFHDQPSIVAPDNFVDRITSLAGRMDEIRPAKNANLRLNSRAASGDARQLAARMFEDLEKTPSAGAPGGSVSPKLFMYFGLVFAAGLGLGVVGSIASGATHIDFASLFAMIYG